MPEKRILINLRRQLLIAYIGIDKAYEFHCASGDKLHPTPVGKFKVIRKHEKYTSKKYNAPMDYAMFFTNSGHAIHEALLVTVTSFARYVGITSFGSHGCVRLSSDDAQLLFKWTPRGIPVEVINPEEEAFVPVPHPQSSVQV